MSEQETAYKIQCVALARCVLAVATERAEGWCAYCDAVPGKNHGIEWREVKRVGNKLPEHIANAIFPDFVGLCPYIL